MSGDDKRAIGDLVRDTAAGRGREGEGEGTVGRMAEAGAARRLVSPRSQPRVCLPCVIYHAELKALGQAAALESGMLALQTTLSEYARLAQEVLPAGQDVVHSLHGLQAIAAAKLTLMVVSLPEALAVLFLAQSGRLRFKWNSITEPRDSPNEPHAG